MISMELRGLIIQNWEKGVPVKDIAEMFGVCKAAIYNMINRYKETGSIHPAYVGRAPSVTPEQLTAMKQLVEKRPDITLEEIRETLHLPVKKSQIANLLKDMGFRFKKRWSMPGSKNGPTS